MTWWNNSVKMWPFTIRVLHSRSPSVRASLLHHRQGFISGHRQLEGEGWGRGRGYSHSSSAEQNWPAGTDRCKEVSSSCCFFAKKNPQVECKGNNQDMFLVFSSHSSEEAEALAKRLKLRFYRASVKEDLNVNEGELLWKRTNDYLYFFCLNFAHTQPTGSPFSF